MITRETKLAVFGTHLVVCVILFLLLLRSIYKDWRNDRMKCQHMFKGVIQPGTVNGPTEYFEVCSKCGMEKPGSDIDLPECEPDGFEEPNPNTPTGHTDAF